jgi:hypothetical protein
MLKENEFKNLLPKGTKLSQIDTIRDTLKIIEIQGLYNILKYIIRKAIKNKTFDNGTIDGYTVAAIDGTKFFGSYLKYCNDCISTIVRGKTNYYHSGAVMSIIGDGPKLTLGFEMYKPGEDSESKDEGEINVSKRLISDVFTTYKNLIDVVVYDALACNSVWINHCIELKVDVIVRAKNNKNSSIREVKRKTNKQEPGEVWTGIKGFERVDVFETTFAMDNVHRPLRFVKFAMKRLNKKRSQIMIVTTLMETTLQTLFKMIRARWDIENSVFNNLKTECGLEHCYVHGGNAVEAVLYLIFIAANIMQLFLYRRIKKHVETQRELIRLLLKGLYLMKYDSRLVFSSA